MLWLRRARLINRSEANRRRPASASASRRASAVRSVTSSVTCQKRTMPAHAASTATPWTSDHSHGFAWPAGWLKIRSRRSDEPSTWLTTVNAIMNSSGSQSR